MNDLFQFSKKKIFFIILAGLLLRIITAIGNYGFLAVDDYTILFFSIPAQVASGFEGIDLTGSKEVRSILPEKVIQISANLAWKLGLIDPLNQVQFVFIVLGFFSILIPIYIYKLFNFLERKEEAVIGALLGSFFWILPFISTRALIEVMSAPFLLISAYHFIKYIKKDSKIDLLIAILFVTIAAMFRFQSGFSAFIIPLYILLNKKWKDIPIMCLGFIICFFFSGLPDFIWRGTFHSSLIAYIQYNLKNSSNYGTSPFYSYIPTMILITLPPSLFSLYKNFNWKEKFIDLKTTFYFFLIFFVLHSIIPHKEERFLIPILPLFLVLLTPLIHYLYYDLRAYKRLIYFFIMNVIFLTLLAIDTIQHNTIGVVRWLYKNENIKSVTIYEDSMNVIPMSYAIRGNLGISYMTKLDFDRLNSTNCEDIIVIRQDYYKEINKLLFNKKLIYTSKTSILERILIQTNPRANKRRNSIDLYQDKSCN
ncbi:MAG: glycosyltransferase family 39 protein [Leptospiraceae bacterium]|nr:glycosyltransferase family 39 protein [Leptospiraceae bacterium]